MENRQIEQIKNYMKANKIRYEELSSKSGIPIGTIKSIFSGRTPTPRIDTMRAIETALGLTSDSAWTADDYANGFSRTVRVSITPDEDDILYLYRRIGQQLGEAGQQAFKEMGETILKMDKK